MQPSAPHYPGVENRIYENTVEKTENDVRV
jgi:hypothetical protein